jgi:hypothetical protein
MQICRSSPCINQPHDTRFLKYQIAMSPFARYHRYNTRNIRYQPSTSRPVSYRQHITCTIFKASCQLPNKQTNHAIYHSANTGYHCTQVILALLKSHVWACSIKIELIYIQSMLGYVVGKLYFYSLDKRGVVPIRWTELRYEIRLLDLWWKPGL